MKSLKKFTLCASLLTVFLILGGCTSQEDKYNLGLDAMKNNEWDTAIEYFSNIEFKDSKELLEKCKKEKGMHEKSDYDFLDTMGKSLMKRFEISEAHPDDKERCIQTELEMIGKFKDAEFYDLELQKLAVEYIDGVEIEKQSLSEANGNKQLKYYEGHAKRFESLKALTDNYGFLADNVDYKTNYYNKTDKEIERYAAYKEIETDINNQQIGNSINYVDYSTYRMHITNNTKYDYDMSIHFIIYDENETIVYTSDNYYEDIKSGSNYNIDFYAPDGAHHFTWYAEEFIDL